MSEKTQLKIVKEDKFKFTPREVECIKQVAQGRSLSEISKALKISKNTLKFYLNSINHKFNMLFKQM